MMRLFAFLFMLFSLSAATHLISTSDVETLLRKFVLNELTEEDIPIWKDTLELLRRPEYVTEKPLENSSQARASLDCFICRAAFGALFQGILNGQTDDEATEAIVTLCTSLGIESHDVCQGAISLNMPIFGHIIRTVPEATPAAFCGLILQNANDPSFCSFEDPRFEWTVELPEKSDLPSPVPQLSNLTPLKIAIITDAHLDPLYQPFGVAECDAPTCCRVGQSPARSFTYKSNVDESLIQEALVDCNGELKLNLTVAAKIRKRKQTSRTMYQKQNAPAPAGYWGDYRRCDTPIWAFDDAIETIQENHKDIDFVYFIGDTIDHGVWETSYELINYMNRYLVEKIRKAFGDDVKVIPALGNHESQPTNQFAPSGVVGDKLNTTWLYQGLVDKWGFYLTDEAKADMLERGAFSLLLRPGLRVISINNNIAYRDNWWLVYDPLDSKRHLDWLVRELYKAELAGEKVHVLAHIPPGVHDLLHTWTREYNRIVDRFSATIAAEFNGHTHSDEFKIFYSPAGAPANVAWGAGSLTAYTFYNLNYKIATFNPETFAPNTFVNYAYNLTEANLTPQQRPHWFLLYDMKNSFGLTDLSAQSMHDLVYSMAGDKRQLLSLYNAFYSKISDFRWPYCDDNCKIDNLCRIVVTVLWERERCEELRNIFFN